MAQKVGNVEFYAGPDDVGAPDNLEKIIVDFIKGAQKRLEIAVQELESRPIAEAIIDARKRKVIVKVVLEQDYLRASRTRQNPWLGGGGKEENREIQNALFRSNIDLKLDYNTSIFHQKFIVRDRNSLLTGSTNFTPTGTHNNLNHVVIVKDPKVAKIYSREFKEIQQGHFGKLNEGHDPAPTDVVVSNIPIRVLFAPDHNPEMEIMKQMLKARKRIDFAIFTFSKSSGIDDTMIRLLETGFPIRGAFDVLQGGQSWAAISDLKAKGAELFKVPPGNGVGKLHHKLMVLDEEVVIAGSFNYTGPANRLNDENIIILGDLDTTSNTQRKAQKKIAQFARTEIGRIIDDHGNAM
ncbi:MAG: phospholipase D-like domain-containing protein [Ignavibacteria bacterium]|nr:phospholipase D-like domain-containing protein [Ignavibacteria bacterium]